MTGKELQHGFSALEEVRPCRIVEISLTRVECLKPVSLLGRFTLGAAYERLEEAIPDESEWRLEGRGQSDDAEGEGKRSDCPADE